MRILSTSLAITVMVVLPLVSSANEEMKIQLFAESKCKEAYEYHFMNRAAYWGDMIGLKLLLESGADPNGSGYKNYPECVAGIEFSSPLMVAMWGGHLDIMEFLLEKGASPNIVEGEGYTPLFFAVEKGNIEAIKILIKHGAKIEVPGQLHIYNPLEKAKKDGNKEVIDLLSNK